VRDNIVEIIKDKGKKVSYEILDNERYGEELEKKLKEEVNEYLKDQNIEELADIIEVLYATIEYKGASIEEVDKRRTEKALEKGVFKNKVFLKTVEED
jgi:predicted house-cleaning noncanonical NTP pyrophosphatase (MazG superfamily)